MDWDRQRDRIGFDQKAICDIWHVLAWAGKFGLELGPRRTGAGLYLRCFCCCGCDELIMQ